MKPLPERIQIGWQVFVRRPTLTDYWTLRETLIQLVSFKALCADCGKPFDAKASKTAWRKKHLARRCDRHKRPSIWVDNLKPPIPIAELPWWAKPVARQIKKTAALRRYGKVKPPARPAEPARALKAPAAPRRPPDLSYLD